MIAFLKNTAISSQIIGSLLVHSLVIYFVLSLPIYKPGTYGAPVEGFIVYLGSEEGAQGIKANSFETRGTNSTIADVAGQGVLGKGWKAKKVEHRVEPELAVPPPVKDSVEDPVTKAEQVHVESTEADAGGAVPKERKPSPEVMPEITPVKTAVETPQPAPEESRPTAEIVRAVVLSIDRKETAPPEKETPQPEKEVAATIAQTRTTSPQEAAPAPEVKSSPQDNVVKTERQQPVQKVVEVNPGQAMEARVAMEKSEPAAKTIIEPKRSLQAAATAEKVESVPKADKLPADDKVATATPKDSLPANVTPAQAESANVTPTHVIPAKAEPEVKMVSSAAAGRSAERFREDVVKKEDRESMPAPRFSQAETNEKEKPAMGIPVPEVLIPKDIKVEILPDGEEIQGIHVRMAMRTYPSNDANVREIKKEVEMLEEKGALSQQGKRLPGKGFSVVKADKGIYTLLMENKGAKIYRGEVVVHLFETKKEERIRKYATVKLDPGAVVKFRFVIPDMVFWDEEDRFSGSIESSDYITKFNYDSGLVWKEEKD